MKSKSELKEFIREVIKEMTSTASVGTSAPDSAGPPKLKHAYKKTDGTDADEDESPRMKKIAKHSMPPQRESNVVNPNNPDDLNEAYSRYKRFKESDTYKQSKSKVSYVMMEVKKMLREVNYLVDISTKLKQESDLTNDKLWNRTEKDLAEINSSIKEIAHKIRKFK